MQVLDYHRSCFMFEMDFVAFPPKTVTDRRQNLHNRARIRIDCRCTITDEDGSRCDFYLGESCKTERVGADRALGIFTQPNADVRPVMSEEETLILKSWERNDRGVMLTPPSLGPQPERHVIPTREAFHDHRFMLACAEGAMLDTPSAVVEAVDAGSPLVARTAFTSGGTGSSWSTRSSPSTSASATASSRPTPAPCSTPTWRSRSAVSPTRSTWRTAPSTGRTGSSSSSSGALPWRKALPSATTPSP